MYVIIIVTIIIVFSITPYKKYKIINGLKDVVNIKTSKTKPYDFIIDEDELYLCKILFVSKQSTLQINSKMYWQLNYGYRNGTYKNRRLLKELNRFLKQDDVNKVLIIYPNVKSIKKHINESELQFVKSGEIVHGVVVFNFNEFNKDKLLNIDLSNKKW